MCVCMCIGGGEVVQATDVKKVRCRGCTQAEVCRPWTDKYVHRVGDSGPLVLSEDQFEGTPGLFDPSSLLYV